MLFVNRHGEKQASSPSSSAESAACSPLCGTIKVLADFGDTIGNEVEKV
jgi:hypothetical protein